MTKGASERCSNPKTSDVEESLILPFNSMTAFFN